jgi:hypothetical protein
LLTIATAVSSAGFRAEGLDFSQVGP